MANYENPSSRYGTAVPAAGVIDEGLRAFMLRVYNYMGIGLAVTGVVSYLVATLSVTDDPAAAAGVLPRASGDIYLTNVGTFLLGGSTFWFFLIAAVAFAMFLGSRLNQLKIAQAQAAFWGYAALIGAALSPIFLIYTSESIAQVFFITAATFGAVSLYGYTTKADLSRYRSFLIMGVIGIFLAIVVNWFLGSEALMFAISVIGVLVFTGLTAYQTQNLKLVYSSADGEAVGKAKAISGALTLYVSFLYMFQFLLMLLGNRE